jgi:Tol biopolymer transport system component
VLKGRAGFINGGAPMSITLQQYFRAVSVAAALCATVAGTGNAGARQIFYTVPGGTVRQMSKGQGTSRNPSVGIRGRIVVFDSTSDPVSGADTGVPQVFMYDTNTHTFARITNEPGGCTGASSARIKRDWRIGYVCSGTGYFTMLRANQRFRVQTDGGDTTRLSPQGDAHFVLVATTADLAAGSGTTAGHRVYMVNLYARPPSRRGSSCSTWGSRNRCERSSCWRPIRRPPASPPSASSATSGSTSCRRRRRSAAVK